MGFGIFSFETIPWLIFMFIICFSTFCDKFSNNPIENKRQNVYRLTFLTVVIIISAGFYYANRNNENLLNGNYHFSPNHLDYNGQTKSEFLLFHNCQNIF